MFKYNLDRCSSNRDNAPRTKGELFYIFDSCHVSKSVKKGKIRKKPHLTQDVTCKTTKPQAYFLKTEKHIRTKSNVCENCCSFIVTRGWLLPK